MNRRHLFYQCVYWLFVTLPLMAALWLFQTMPSALEVVPGIYFSTGRGQMWILPIVNALFGCLFFPLSCKMAKNLEQNRREQGKTTDILQVLPGIQAYIAASFAMITLAALHGHTAFDGGVSVQNLTSKAFALVLGAGLSLFALQLPRAGQSSFLALHFSHTHKCQKVWGKTHALAAKVLYAVGAILMLTAFLLSGWMPLFFGTIAPMLSLGALYYYAKYLYESDFHR